jgi:hypothetical protein
MNARVVRAGIAAGIAGGAVMAVFSMMMLWLAGSGFWTPLNLIAHTFWRSRLLARTALFYLGLAGVLVPLGMGSSAASTLVYGHQAALTTTAGVLLIVLGILQVAGGGFTIPGLARLRARVRGQSVISVLALGAVSAWPGFAPGRSWARYSPSRPPPLSHCTARRCLRSTPPG